MAYIGLHGGEISCNECGGTYGHRMTCIRRTQGMDSTIRDLLAQTTARAEAMQAALWKLEKMTLWERLWYGRSVVRDALKIKNYASSLRESKMISNLNTNNSQGRPPKPGRS